SVAFHPREPLLASGGNDQKVIVRDLSTGVEVRSWNNQPDNPIGSLAFSPGDGELLAVAPSALAAIGPGPDRDVYLVETGTGLVRQRLRRHAAGGGEGRSWGLIPALAFDPGGKRLVAGGATDVLAGSVLVWDVVEG